MCELAGYTGNVSNAGTFNSAMQGLNTSNNYYVDAQGGTQFAYFKPYNASGGGEKLWVACHQQSTWLRSPDIGQAKYVTRIADASTINTYILPTAAYAVHSAGVKQALFLSPTSS